jgi:hydroxymethylglutaryl-CoA lyase
MSDRVRIHEVSLRDGLQNEPDVVPTATKLQHLDRLLAAGFTDIEVTSFVRPRWVPQLADAADVARSLPEAPGVRFWALVPNPVGLDRALDAQMRHVATILSASETHNQKNVNRTVAESMAGLRQVIRTAVAEGVTVRAYVSTVFGCPYEGPVDPRRTLDLALELLALGAEEIALGDTIGAGTPRQVREILGFLVDGGLPLERTACHFHDTRGTALLNAWVAYEFGVRTFDGSVGGVGGCPYAPGAAGNVASEDLAYLFQESGVETGIDLESACLAGEFMENVLGRRLPGRYLHNWQGQRERAARRAARSA